MRYNQIREMDIANGEGIRTSLFVQGCAFHCKGCFNTETWDFKGGKEWTKEIENKFIELTKSPFINGITILGGEPLHPNNVNDVLHLVKRIRKELPKKTIWLYTGYTLEILNEKQREVVNNIDILVEGRFVEELKDYNLKFRGSSNQNIINIKDLLNKEE